MKAFFLFIKSGFTTDNGELDDARLAAFIMVLSYIGTGIYAVYLGQKFDAQSWGIGAGALAAGVGVWFGQRGSN